MKSKTRVLTAIALLPVFVAAVVWLPPVYFAMVLALAGAVALAEFYLMYKVPRLLMVVGIALAFALIWARHEGYFFETLAACVLLVSAIRLFTGGGPKGALSDVGPVVFGLLYVPVLMSFQLPLHKAGWQYIIFLYVMIWCSDAAAYYVGSSIGKHKLYEPISPNKTWEGAAGSVLAGSASAVLLKLFLLKDLPLEKAVIIGLAAGVVAIMGDLVESLFKRDAGVKDSGTSLPGHGGLLDKLDGVLFVGPLLYWLLTAFGIIGGAIGPFKLPF